MFDRRHVGRQLEEEWGMPPQPQKLTTCVRRFGRERKGAGETKANAHITGARMATNNGHEVLLCMSRRTPITIPFQIKPNLSSFFYVAYSADSVYLYSTLDDEKEPSMFDCGILKPNSRHSTPGSGTHASPSHSHSPPMSRPRSRASVDQLDTIMEEDIERFLSEHVASDQQEDDNNTDWVEQDDEESEDEHMSDVEDGFYRDMPEEHSSVPVVLPRDKFTGICNVQTVKDGMFPVSSK